eukprot:scaffold3615_cov66-Cylindrotheca_fusiformis.AAC.1
MTPRHHLFLLLPLLSLVNGLVVVPGAKDNNGSMLQQQQQQQQHRCSNYNAAVPSSSSSSATTNTRLFASSFDIEPVTLVPLTLALTSFGLSYIMDQDSDFFVKLASKKDEEELVMEPETQIVVVEAPSYTAETEEEKEDSAKTAKKVVRKVGGVVQFIAFPWLPLLRPSTWRRNNSNNSTSSSST